MPWPTVFSHCKGFKSGLEWFDSSFDLFLYFSFCIFTSYLWYRNVSDLDLTIHKYTNKVF
jgi:hypothetical protein